MSKFIEPIKVEYPPNNKKIFEEWFFENYTSCNTDRELLPIFPTSFHVNNGYGAKKEELQMYCDTLDEGKKYFIICQYDDGCMVDWKGKDVLEFNMSKNTGVTIPLLCMPHPYKFIEKKKYVANFIGSRTHPIRNELEKFKGLDEWYISFEPHNIEDYCRILSESIYTICPRGYGLNSFRISEGLQYNSIPIYISDEFVLPFSIDFTKYGVLIPSENLFNGLKLTTDRFLGYLTHENLQDVYNAHYTYNGCFKNIINYLETEFDLRK